MLNKRFYGSAVIVLLFVAACGGGGGGGGGGTSPTGPMNAVVIVEMEDFEFVPRQLQVAPGTTVRWIRRGLDPDHTTKSKLARWNSGFIFTSQGDMFEHTFTAADDGKTFEYFCETHVDTEDMKGSVRVGASAPDPMTGY